MADDRISGFTSDRARRRFLRAYADMRQRRLRAGLTEMDVPTSYGVTRAYRTGGEGVPFVLLPGAGGNSLSWYAYVPGLRASRPVILIDPIGEPGGSVQAKPLPGGDEWVRWLDETFAALKVDRAHL